MDKILHAQLVRDEGLRLSAYLDSLGYTTIGVGRCIDARKHGQISWDEAEYLLSNDIARVTKALSTELPWFTTLDPVRRRVLQNMAFNLGMGGLLMFHRFLDACRIGDYDTAANEMTSSLWAKQVGARATRLSTAMRTGQDAI